jgi:hypothetical protein
MQDLRSVIMDAADKMNDLSSMLGLARLSIEELEDDEIEEEKKQGLTLFLYRLKTDTEDLSGSLMKVIKEGNQL